MIKKTKVHVGLCVLLLSLLVACDAQSDTFSISEIQNPVANTVTEDTTGVTLASRAINTDTAVAMSDDAAESVAEATAANSAVHDDAEDYLVDDAAVTQIVLTDDAITVTGDGVVVDGRLAIITAAGSYTLSGTLTDGQLAVDTNDEGVVHLILNGVDIRNSSTAPIYIANADETVIELAANSENYVADGASYIFSDAEVDEPNAAVFSKDDLTIYGSGSLTVDAYYNDGITSKDGLIIAGGTIVVNAADDGIRGKDYLVVKDGTITVTAQGDGLKSDEDEDTTKGYITVTEGQITITSGGDAIQAQTDVLISGGTFDLTSGGGSNSSIAADASAKGIKAGVNVNIDGGTFTIDAADDALHSNDNLVINNGTFVLTTGDDGLHADATLELNGGVIDIIDSYEGIESAVIAINNGEFHVVSSDDGINVTGGNDGSGFGPGGGGGPRPGGGFNGGPGQDTFTTYTGDNYLYINGGYVVVDAGGDGIDVNGAIAMTDGVVIVNGPTEQMNGAVDYDGTFTLTGGFLVAAGSAGMAETADASSTQYSLLLNLNGTLQAGTLIHIADSDGNDVLTFAPTKAYQSIAFSSPELRDGGAYTVYYGGSASGAAVDGLYEGGSYDSGTEYTSFTVSSIVTMIGNAGRR